MAAARGASPQSPSRNITVVDVYDLAASIGKDFEKLIQLYGNDCIKGLMPKVISALETLESMASHNDRSNEEVMEMQKTVYRLEQEKLQRLQNNQKFEEEIEQIEENYKQDIAELRDAVRSLTHENRTLSSTVSSLPRLDEMVSSQSGREEDVKALLEVREMSSRQKHEIKQLQRDVEQYSCEVENLQNSIDKLIRQNEELLRKNSSLQKQGRMIVEEKVEIMRRLERTEEANIQLRKLLSETDRACKDLQQVSQLENEPRFTLAELREVLQEKNVLKGRVMELEEELDTLRPGSKRANIETLTLEDTPPPGDHLTDDDLPVYGPMPREPEEKLYPWKYERKDSGVRRLFRFVMELGGSSPRRGSNSMTSSPRPVRSTTLNQMNQLGGI